MHIKPNYWVQQLNVRTCKCDFDAKAWSAFCYFDNVIRNKINKRTVRYGLV